MKLFTIYIFSLCLLSISLWGFSQTTQLSKDYNSVPEISFTEGEEFNSCEITSENSNEIGIPTCGRFYQANNSYFSFQTGDIESFSLKMDFRDSLGGGISLYELYNNEYIPLKCIEFFGSEVTISAKNESKENSTIVAQIWFVDPNYQGIAHIKLKPYATQSNIKVPNIDIDTYTPQQLVQDILISGCVEAQNVTFTGDSRAIGYFDNGNPGLSFDDGIIMSTGKVADAPGPNNNGSVGHNFHEPGDADLTAVAGMNTHDAAVLEFDFIPASDYVTFEYVFGSEEYEEFVGQSFNDVFGFFVSGGPEAYDKVNIARIPVSGVPVSINNVNQNDNTAYYINNDMGIHLQFDGMTVTLTAEIAVTQCETYHMKLAIADSGDGAYDSGVFLKAGSFNSGASVVMRNYNAWGQQDTVHEGCTNELVFARSDLSNITEDMDVVLTVGGTATNGVDNTTIQTNYTIPAGQESISVFMDALTDGFNEGSETVIITIFNGCPCSVQTNETTITILDEITFIPAISNNGPICEGDSAQLSIIYLPQPDTVRVEWSNGVIGPSSIWVHPTSTTTYTADIYYPCSSKTVSTTVTVNPAPIITASNDGPYCVGDDINLEADGGVSYRWRGPDFYLSLQQNPVIADAQVTHDGTYQVTVTGSNGCKSIESTYVDVNPLPIVDLTSNSPFCSGDPISFLIDVFPDYYYYGPLGWNSVDASPVINNSSEPNEGWYYVIITDANGCREIDSTFIEINPTPTANAWSNSPVCDGEDINLFSDGGPTYTWTGPDSFTSTDQNPVINGASSINSGDYTVSVENAFGCTDSDVTSFVVNPNPDASFTNPGPLCIDAANIILSPTTPGGTWSGTGIVDLLTGEFSPAIAGAGSHNITYQLIVNGCLSSEMETITIDFIPNINISAAGPFCISDASTNLVTTTPGGTWSGTGITDGALGTFDPPTAGAGDHIITYTLVNGTCTNTDQITIHVDTDVDATITPAGPFCENDPALNLVANTVGGTWSGTGITDGALGTFDPLVANPGIHTITYDIANGACIDSDTELLTVYMYPNSNFFDVGPYCITNAAEDIIPVTSGGTFSGTGITDAVNGTFDPATAGEGTHNITYTLINGACTSITTKPVIVYGDVDATITPAGPFCETDAALNLSSVDPGGTWSGTGITDGALGTFDPAVAGAGVHTITYDIANGDCNDSDTENIIVFLSPNADFFAIGPLCETDAAQNLVAVTSGGTWSGTGITDGALGTFDPPTAGSGTHQITYTLINGPCTSVITKPIVVDSNIDATITPAGPFCENEAETTLVSADAGGTWSGTGITNATTGSFNPAIAGPGIHAITYDIVNGACSDSDSENITVDLYPNSSINPAGPFCEGDAATFLTSPTIGGAWLGSGITNAVTGAFDPAIAGAGTHTISYTVINGACTSSSTIDISIDADVDATITPVATVCEFNAAFNLSAVSSGGTWSGTGITDAINGTFDPTIAGPGIHTITYTVGNGVCSDTDTETINVSADPNPTIFAAGPFCEGDVSVNLTAVTAGGTWSGTGITDVNLGTFDPSVASGGDHLITYDITSGACSNSDNITIHVDNDVDASIFAVGPFCQFDAAVNITAVDAGGTWAGNGITDVVNGTFDPTIAGVGTHNITYNISNGLCSDSDNLNIDIIIAPDGSITDPGVFCVTDPAVNLTAVAAGGLWAGPGITNVVNGTFDPWAANSGENVITYTVSNGSCTTIGSISIFVYDGIVDATITSTGPYCISDVGMILTANSTGGTWSGTGITDGATGAFDPSIAGVGSHIITYNVGSVACFDVDTQTIQVDDSLSAIITSAGPVCESGAAFNFTAATAGGTWSGTGITNAALGTFNPVLAGGGTHTITYEISQGTCTNTDDFSVQVDDEVDATITAAGPYCENEAILALNAVSSGGTWSGTGIVNTSTGLFHPSVAGAGDHVITYDVANGTCLDSDTETIHVDSYPNTTISAAGPLCESDAAVNLNGADAGGTWSGTGITDAINGTFDPSVAGSGSHIITYEITNGTCFSSSTITIDVDNFLDATITPVGPFCNTDASINLTAVDAGGVWSGTGITDDALGTFHPGVSGPGDFIIQYSTVNGLCSDNDNITIHVDEYFDATITPAGPYCETELSVNLIAANPGGTWSGNGIIVPGAGTFDPAIAGGGDHIITYEIVNGSCTSNDTGTIHVDQSLDPTITPAGPFCENDASLNITAATAGGTWTGTGITNASLGSFNPAVASPGDHIITYEIINGECTSSDTETIHVDLNPNTTLASFGPYCESDAIVNLTEPSTGGTWSGTGIINVTTGDFDPSIAGGGTHLITYTITNGACNSVGTTNISVDSEVDATITPVGPYCSTDASVVLVAATTGGTWSGTGIVNDVTGLFNPVTAGLGNHVITYTVTNGLCSDTDNTTITIEASPDATITSTGPYCQNEGNQVFTSATPGGVWTGSGIDMMGNFNPSVAGVGTHQITYTLTIGACVAVDQVDIVVNEYFDAAITSTGPYCFNDAPIMLNSTNPNGVWSGDGVATNGLFSPALAGVGNHNISYTIINGACTDSDTQTISVNNNPDATITPVDPICLNEAIFNLSSATVGGIWSGTGITDAVSGAFDPQVAGSGLHNINYELTVLGCTSSENIIITVNSLPTVEISNIDTDYCLDESAVLVNVSPPGGILEGGNIVGTQFTPSLAGVGTHQITYAYTDVNSCSDTAYHIVNVHDLPTTSIAGIDAYYCQYADTVYPVLLPVGGMFEGFGTYNDIAFVPEQSGPGEFDLFYHFTDVNGCKDTSFVSTTVLSTPEIEFTITEPTCYGDSDGIITTITTGGLEPYNYEWSDASSTVTADITSLSADRYYLTITDGNDCQKIDSIDLTQPDTLIVTITNSMDASCFGLSDGRAITSVSGGTPEYSYLWNDTNETESSIALNLEEGTYTITVTDEHSCTASVTVEINEPEDIYVNFIDIENVSCYSFSNGSVSVEPVGGTSPYEVVWNNPSSSTTFPISGLEAGYYTATITDDHDCEFIDSVEITQPDSITIEFNTNNVTCTEFLGSAGVTINGGTAPYDYLWSTEEIGPIILNLIVGTYEITIEDSNGCLQYDAVDIEPEGEIDVTISQTSHNLCFKDELATISGLSTDGEGPFNYLWSNFVADSLNPDLPAGTYTLSITDSWGCIGIDSIVVTEPGPIEIEVNSDDIKCHGELTGRASISVSGGTAPYYPLWQNGDETYASNTLPAGTIWVTVTDFNNCVDSAFTVINEPDKVVSIGLNITAITCYDAQDGAINSFASGGTPPYFYYWYISGQELTDPTIRPLDIGEYSLTITDNNNCSADTTIILTEPDPLMATAISGDPSCSGNYDGYIHIATTGGTEPYRYFMMDFELESAIVDSLYQGDYYIEIQDSNYCEYSFGPVTLIDTDRDCLNIPAAFSPNGDGYNDDWYLENIHLYTKSIVQIYNRWGQLLYEEPGPDGFWDGNYNGKPVPTGVYIYLIIMGTDEENRNGTVTIIR